MVAIPRTVMNPGSLVRIKTYTKICCTLTTTNFLTVRISENDLGVVIINCITVIAG